MAKRKVSAEVQDWISRKIKYLMDEEEKSRREAIGQAYGMARQKFGARRVPKR